MFSDVFALEDAADTLPRFCTRSQRLGSATTVSLVFTYKLLEIGGHVYDGGRCLVRVRPIARRQRGVELERLGHGQKCSCIACRRRSRCRSPQWSPYLGLAGLTRRAHNVLGVWRSDVIHVVLCVVLNLRGSASPLLGAVVSSSCAYLGVVGGACAIAVHRRRVDGGRIRAWRRKQVVGSRRSWGTHQYAIHVFICNAMQCTTGRTCLRRPG